MSNIYALIVTFKRKELLKEVVKGVLQQSKSVSKIIIVDNNSNDGTEELIKKLNETSNIEIEYYNTGANLGGAGGFSFGFEQAIKYNFDYLWVMDDDVLPAPDCLELLEESATNNIIVQPIRYNKDGSCAEYSPVIFDLDSIFITRPKRQTVVEMIDNSQNNEIALDGIPFEGPLVSRKIIDTIGLPDARFFIFYDDLDFALRAKNAGFQIICKTNAKATRLLLNNQETDLQSWKGYFMLRNFFRIHFIHGKNIFVKIRPLIIAPVFIVKELLFFRGKAAKICLDALVDALRYDFKVRNKYIP